MSSAEQIIDDFSRLDAEAWERSGMGSGAEVALRVQDFILPQIVEGDSSGPYLLRPRMERWPAEQVKRFWIPLEDIALDLIRRENDRRIEKLFEEIP